jgi:hypothetical protein
MDARVRHLTSARYSDFKNITARIFGKTARVTPTQTQENINSI